MGEFRPNIESSEQPLDLVGRLKKLYRILNTPGMEGEKVEDPVAEEILRVGSDTLQQVESFLKENGVESLTPIEGAYGFSAVVFDAGNNIVRLSRMKPTEKPNIPYVLQPLAAEIIGPISVQISKKLNTHGITEAEAIEVENNLKAEGYDWRDPGADNLGRDENGKLFIIDGSVIKMTEDNSKED